MYVEKCLVNFPHIGYFGNFRGVFEVSVDQKLVSSHKWRYQLFRAISPNMIASCQACLKLDTDSKDTSIYPRRKTKAMQYISFTDRKRTRIQFKCADIMMLEKALARKEILKAHARVECHCNSSKRELVGLTCGYPIWYGLLVRYCVEIRGACVYVCARARSSMYSEN